MKMQAAFFFFLLLACAPLHLTSAHIVGSRRSLHQTFFPQEYSTPPSSSPPSLPSPPIQDYPFTPSTSAPDQSPFFPSYPSPPPPPPSTAFASFPANVSSLSLPHSAAKPKPISTKLLALSIAAFLVALVLVSAVIFFFCRKRRRFRNQNKPDGSNGNTVGVRPPAAANANKSNPRTTAPETSSEFLYLGTLVNSRGQEGHFGNVFSPGKLDSPELRPLPPLNRNFGQSVHVGSNVGEGRIHDRNGGTNYCASSSSSSSYSSSSSGSSSPNHSHSVSISPPASLSPRKIAPTSPDILQMDPPPTHIPPQTHFQSNVSAPPPPPPSPRMIPKPPALVTPSRPFIVQNPSGVLVNNETFEKREEISKPRLKPLHWDKVRASSGCEMVWDQLKSSSFK